MTPLKRNPPHHRVTCITYPEAGAMGLTGDWRIFRPLLDKEKCTGCQICWMYCPDAAITMDKENKPVVNLERFSYGIFTAEKTLRHTLS